MAVAVIRAGFGRDLQELRDDLEAVEVGLGHLVRQVGVKQLRPIVAEVQGLMPFDPTHRGWPHHHRAGAAPKQDPGHIRDSIKGGTSAHGFTIYTMHAGGPVHWWSGTIRPRGAAIKIEREPGAGPEFTSAAAEQVGREVDREFDDLLRHNRL